MRCHALCTRSVYMWHWMCYLEFSLIKRNRKRSETFFKWIEWSSWCWCCCRCRRCCCRRRRRRRWRCRYCCCCYHCSSIHAQTFYRLILLLLCHMSSRYSKSTTRRLWINEWFFHHFSQFGYFHLSGRVFFAVAELRVKENIYVEYPVFPIAYDSYCLWQMFFVITVLNLNPLN